MIVYVQIVAMLMSYAVYEPRELLILSCWTPIVMLPIFLSQSKKAYTIIVFIYFIDGLINLLHWIILKGPLSASSLFVLLNTNLSEATDFLDIKLNYKILFIIPYFIFFYLALKFKPSKIESKNEKYILLGICVFALLFIGENAIHNRLIRKGVPQSVKAFWSFGEEFSTYKSLKSRKIATVSAQIPRDNFEQHICVLIIGESCNRNHMSLYGYKKITTPRLSQRHDIIVFNNIVSAYSNTLPSVLSMLTQANLDNKYSFDKSVSIIDIFHSCGFKTFWISNQSPLGVWDNAVYNLAQTTDIPVFLNKNANTSFESTYVSSYDEVLFNPIIKALQNQSANKFIVVHLMGNHTAYAKRYPHTFSFFSQSTSYENQIRNEYDNSIRYNDFIVDSILNIIQNYESKHQNIKCSALYLSDHGENVYDENGNVGHDYSGTIPKANVEVPYILWLSPQFLKTETNKVDIIKKNRNKPFVSDDLFHNLIDMFDIKCSVFEKSRSLFNNEYNANRKRILEDNLDYDLKK